MKRLLFSVLLLPFSLLGADPIPFMLATNSAIYGGQTNFFLINGELMTNALVALGYSSGGGTVASTDITDSTVAGRTLLTAVDAAAQLTALGTAALYEPLDGNKYQATNGNLTTLGTLDGAALTNLNGSSIASGTVAAARIDSAMATDVEIAAAITANTNFPALNVGTMVVTNFSVGTTNVPAELAIKANALNPTTTGTFTHGGTNIVATTDRLTLSYGGAGNALVVTNGRVGIGTANPVYELDVSGTVRSSISLRSINSGDANLTTSAAINATTGGAYLGKGISSAYSMIRSNAVPTAAAMGANTATTYFGANKWWLLFTDPSSNIVTGATIGTNGIMALNGLQMNQSEMQPFDSVTNYVIDLTTTQQRIINATNLVVKFLHATNVVAGGQKSVIVLAGTNATVSVELPRPLWICNTNLVTLAANQAVTISMTGYGSDNTNVIATVGPIYSR